MVSEAGLPHKTAMTILAAFALFALSLMPARAGEAMVSPWLGFREAKLRLLLAAPGAHDTRRRGGLEIRLVPGYKTYWRAPGDSGVPPQFDFSATQGLGPVSIDFPLPLRFDDGADGVSWGYRHRVILPFSAPAAGGSDQVRLALTFDIAVCGAMCIPLSGSIALDGAQGMPASQEDATALEAAFAAVPRRLSPEDARGMLTVTREPGEARWHLDFTAGFDGASFGVFPEGRGYWMAGSPAIAADGGIRVDLASGAQPDGRSSSGPLRLTFGDRREAFETVIDLDAAMETR